MDLNDRQITACKRHAGAARHATRRHATPRDATRRDAYKWGLARKQEAYQASGTRPSAIDLHRALKARKKTDLPWMYAVSTCAPHEALRNLDPAVAHLLRRSKLKRDGKLNGPLGYPQRKTKKKGRGSFRLTGSRAVFPDALHLPRLGRLRLQERS